jgi:hypothetical protein
MAVEQEMPMPPVVEVLVMKASLRVERLTVTVMMERLIVIVTESVMVR